VSELSTIVFSTGTSLIAQAASFVITRYPDSYGDKNLSMVIWHKGEIAVEREGTRVLGAAKEASQVVIDLHERLCKPVHLSDQEFNSFDDRLQESLANLRGLRPCTERVAPQVEEFYQTLLNLFEKLGSLRNDTSALTARTVQLEVISLSRSIELYGQRSETRKISTTNELALRQAGIKSLDRTYLYALWGVRLYLGLVCIWIGIHLWQVDKFSAVCSVACAVLICIVLQLLFEEVANRAIAPVAKMLRELWKTNA